MSDTTPAEALCRAVAELSVSEPCLLLDLSHDEVSIVTHELCDPLRPLLAVHLAARPRGCGCRCRSS